MKLPLSCCLTKAPRTRVCYVPCSKGISEKFCLENPESGIQLYEYRIPLDEWDFELKFH